MSWVFKERAECLPCLFFSVFFFLRKGFLFSLVRVMERECVMSQNREEFSALGLQSPASSPCTSDPHCAAEALCASLQLVSRPENELLQPSVLIENNRLPVFQTLKADGTSSVSSSYKVQSREVCLSIAKRPGHPGKHSLCTRAPLPVLTPLEMRRNGRPD